MELENLHIKATKKSPEINCVAKSGELLLKGKSIPENASLIYKPILNWVTEYIKAPVEETNLHLDLEYFNTASSIWIAKILKSLSQIDNNGKLLIAHLYIDMEDFEEMQTEDLAELTSPITDILKDAIVSIGIKVYGKDDSDSIVKEKLILL